MHRAVALIAAAIQLSQPKMPAHTAKAYAAVVQEEAVKRDFDPFTLVSIVHFESWWTVNAVGRGGRDLGLAQIRFQYLGACRNDADPVHNPSPECQRIKSALMDPIYNIRYAAGHITKSREFCIEKVGKATYHGWLSAWQGTHKPGAWCQENKHTRLRVRYRDKLVKLANSGKLRLRNGT